jgi:hypothetical protein
MSTIKLSPEFLAQLHELAVSWGKSAAKRAATELGPDLPIDFTDIETFVALVNAGMTEGAVAALLEQKAHGLTEVPCPACARTCPVERHERPLTLPTGQVVALNEPISHCPECRRDFFPPPDRPATG